MLKIVLVGNSYVGKTSMLTRFMDDKFEDNFISTIGVDFVYTYPEIQDHLHQGKEGQATNMRHCRN